MLTCAVAGCAEPAARGEAWTGESLGPVEQYRVGIKLELAVKDLAVRLVLCDAHAQELTGAAWEALLSRLGSWGWRPLKSSGG